METGPGVNSSRLEKMDEVISHQHRCQKKVAGKRKERKTGRGGLGNRLQHAKETLEDW